jgi:predicted DNA-binding transcriptional regulator AlpA
MTPTQADLQQQVRSQMEALLTKPQLAKLLQVSTRTIDRWLSEDRLPDALRVEISGTVRFRHDIAAEWVAAGCPRSGDDLRDARQVDR